MKKFIVIRTRFEATHMWTDCNIEEVNFLKNEHRHMFYVEVKLPVTHNNRQLEFLTIKSGIDAFIEEELISYVGKGDGHPSIGGKSCEDIAEAICEKFKASFVSVFEDEENGAEVKMNWKEKKTKDEN
jgi:hypothetical protein